MKISIVVYGTRGDVQPMLALADALIHKGHDILICANPENENLVKSYRCHFVPFGPNVKEKSQKRTSQQQSMNTSQMSNTESTLKKWQRRTMIRTDYN